MGAVVRVELRRTRGQRAFAWFFVVLAVLVVAIVPVFIVRAAANDLLGRRWWVVILLVAAGGALWWMAGWPAIRVLRAGPRFVTLDATHIEVVDESVLRRPLRIDRTDVMAIERAPTRANGQDALVGRLSQKAALVSLFAEQPNVLVKLTTPRKFPNAISATRLSGPFPILTIRPRVIFHGLWLRTATDSDADQLVHAFHER
jgi:hypothetical protein